MLLQKQPNSWSCLPTAFAMVMDLPVEELILATGHDGSAELWERYHQSWHIQEIILAALKLGFATTELHDVCESAPYIGVKPLEQVYNLQDFFGLLGICQVPQHALAFSNGLFYDPASGLRCTSPTITSVIWLINRIDYRK